MDTNNNKLKRKINDLIGMFEKVDYTVEYVPILEPKLDIEPKPVSTKSASKKPKRNLSLRDQYKLLF